MLRSRAAIIVLLTALPLLADGPADNIADNVRRFLAGQPVADRVDPAQGY